MRSRYTPANFRHPVTHQHALPPANPQNTVALGNAVGTFTDTSTGDAPTSGTAGPPGLTLSNPEALLYSMVEGSGARGRDDSAWLARVRLARRDIPSMRAR